VASAGFGSLAGRLVATALGTSQAVAIAADLGKKSNKA
jgi:hypothetical protein